MHILERMYVGCTARVQLATCPRQEPASSHTNNRRGLPNKPPPPPRVASSEPRSLLIFAEPSKRYDSLSAIKACMQPQDADNRRAGEVPRGKGIQGVRVNKCMHAAWASFVPVFRETQLVLLLHVLLLPRHERLFARRHGRPDERTETLTADYKQRVQGFTQEPTPTDGL